MPNVSRIQGWDNVSEIHISGFLGLWGIEPMQLFLFWLILKILGTSAKNAAKTIIPKS